jgi:hypothetical protein
MSLYTKEKEVIIFGLKILKDCAIKQIWQFLNKIPFKNI